jgi:basic secretory peptidase family protein
MLHPRRLFAGVAALALAGTAGVVAVRLQQGDSTPGSNAAAVEVTATPGQLTDAQKATRKSQIDVLLAKRATAVLKDDLTGFLAAVDPKQPQLVARQRLLFTNLQKFGFRSLKYVAAEEREVSDLVTKYGPSTFTTRVMMRYQLSGLDAKPVQTDVGYTFTQRSGAWVLVEDNAVDAELSPDGHRQPWDYQEVAVVRRGKIVVVVDKGELKLGQKIAKVSQGAVDGVRRHWPRPWNGAVMVVAMSEPRVMALLWTSGSGSGWTIAAKAVSLYDEEPIGEKTTPTVSSRIVVNPAVRKQLDEDLLVHEMTHVATLPIGSHTPIWLIEGVAEYVRCASIEDDPHWTVDPYRKTVRTKYLKPMKVLPGPAEFDANGDRAYGQSWWIAAYLVSKLGEKGVASLYADLAQHSTTPTTYAGILKKHTGKTPAQLVAAVKKFKG